MKKKILSFILLCTIILLNGCVLSSTTENSTDVSNTTTKSNTIMTTTNDSTTKEDTTTTENIKYDSVFPIEYDSIETCSDISDFIATMDDSGSTHDNTKKDSGMIISPYFNLKINGKDVVCYSVRTTFGVHSFASVDVASDALPLSVDVSYTENASKVLVLPESYGVKANISGNKVASSTITETGNYTFVLDDNRDMALTVFIREKEDFQIPNGYSVKYIYPGEHGSELAFDKEKEVLYFKKGTHYLKNYVKLISNTEIYLEEGAYLYAVMPGDTETKTVESDWTGYPRWNALFTAYNADNISILGHGVIDLSMLDFHARTAIFLDLCTNIKVDGITLNNSPEWTFECARSSNIEISNILLFGYRQNSDGICLADCHDAIVRDSFARSGDDLFEVKSMYGAHTEPIENITFDNCNAWPDKARGMGIISECKRNMSNIKFINSSIGYASATWMDELGSLVVNLEDEGNGAVVNNIFFENIELHQSDKYPIALFIGQESAAVIQNVYFRNINIKGTNPIRIANNSQKGGEICTVHIQNCYRNGTMIKTFAQLNLSLTNYEKSSIKLNE